MAIVTVQGANHSTITLSYDSDANALLAQHVADVIRAGLDGGTISAADSKFGPPPPVPPGNSGEFVQSTAGVTVLPRAYSFVVDTAPTAVIFGSGAPDESVLVGDGNLTFFATAGSGSIFGGGGNNLISIPTSDAGAWHVDLGNGNNTVRALGGGNDKISVGTGHNVIQLGAGSDFITSAGSDTILAAAGSETVVATGNEIVYGNGSSLLFLGSLGGGTTVYGGSGSDTVFGGSGPDLMFGGSKGNNFLQAGSGAATLFGGGDGDQLYAGGAGAQELHAAAGNATLFGGFASGNDTFYASTGTDQITTGQGNNTVVASTGAATVTATSGGNVLFDFIHNQAGGTELVQDLTDVGQVHIHLAGYDVNEAANAVASQVVVPGSVTVKLSDNTTVTFQNVGSLTAGNFS